MLHCVKPYRDDRKGWAFVPGQEVKLGEADEAWLLRDAPGCFKRPRKRVAKPPVDRAVKPPEVVAK